jgi:hypothetical protein
MVKEVSDESAKEMHLLNSDDEGFIRSSSDNQQKSINKVQMKKQLGLLEGVAIILGIIFGSGITCDFSINKMVKLQHTFMYFVFSYICIKYLY